ncbi:monodehydroascorbate reductase 4, peroxisomal-like [Malus sylvestris]|uniref:monodehydroascorbate reductase 4, peroxisomal-like n=1 Tax=Malus sylvestris TaxID=3752 RepID=UPI0021AC0002|nr:monodehydroascorbate reductase 4, peroxisomal-like [Malus sylvestris]
MSVARLFTPKIASFYEEFYGFKGVKFVKGTILSSFDIDSDRKMDTSENFKSVFSGNVAQGDLCWPLFALCWPILTSSGLLHQNKLEG